MGQPSMLRGYSNSCTAMAKVTHLRALRYWCGGDVAQAICHGSLSSKLTFAELTKRFFFICDRRLMHYRVFGNTLELDHVQASS